MGGKTEDKVQIGDQTPDFAWAAQSGEQVRLSDFRHHGVVVQLMVHYGKHHATYFKNLNAHTCSLRREP
jgi:peroxiredoxin